MNRVNRRRRALAQALAEPGGSTGDAFKARVESDIRKWKGLAEKARLDN